MQHRAATPMTVATHPQMNEGPDVPSEKANRLYNPAVAPTLAKTSAAFDLSVRRRRSSVLPVCERSVVATVPPGLARLHPRSPGSGVGANQRRGCTAPSADPNDCSLTRQGDSQILPSD